MRVRECLSRCISAYLLPSTSGGELPVEAHLLQTQGRLQLAGAGAGLLLLLASQKGQGAGAPHRALGLLIGP